MRASRAPPAPTMSSTDGCRPPRRARRTCGGSSLARSPARRASRASRWGGDRVEIEIEIEMASRRGGGRRESRARAQAHREHVEPRSAADRRGAPPPPELTMARASPPVARTAAGRSQRRGWARECWEGRAGAAAARALVGASPSRRSRSQCTLHCTNATTSPTCGPLSTRSPSRRNTSGSRMSSTRETMPPASRTPTPTQTQTLTLTLTETRPPASRAARRLNPTAITPQPILSPPAHPHPHAHAHAAAVTPTLTPALARRATPQGPNEPIHRHAIPPEAKLARAATATRRRRRARRG